MVKTNNDPFNEEDWNEEPTSIHHLGKILDDIQDKSITKKDIWEYIKLKSIVSSKEDPIKELLFLREHINILSSTMIYLINKRLGEIVNERNTYNESEKRTIDIVDLENPLYSFKQVAKILNVRRQTIYNIVKKGHLRVIKQPGTSQKISSQDLNDYIKKYKTKKNDY